MRSFGMRFMVMSIMMFLLLSSVSYPMGQYPQLAKEDRDDLIGTYTVIFYGGTYLNDPVTVAILDLEGDNYSFKPFTSEYNYQIKNGVPAKLALEESRMFVSNHTDFFSSHLQRITDEKGSILGYEIRPLYHLQRYGRHDILDVYYRMRDKTISVTVDIKRIVRKKLRQRGFGIN